MKRRILVSLVLIATVVVAGLVGGYFPATTAEPKGPEVTVYNSNIALVREVRSILLEKGINQVRVADVPAAIDPTSVYFRSLTDPENTVVLEQNFEYDLVNTFKVLERYIDHEVRITTQDGSVYVGTLLSTQGDIILQDDAGALTFLKANQIQKFELQALPEGLITRPTLVWRVEAAREGRHDVEVAYLTEGMNWQANYVLLLESDETQMDVNVWVTLENHSGGTFKEAKLKLVAGEISRVTPERRIRTKEVMLEAAPRAEPQVEERAFFEYHLYEVKRPVTILNNQTKQIEFIRASQVPIQKRYILNLVRAPYGGGVIADPEYGSKAKGNPQVYITFKTGKESGLNVPLPAGVVRMYKADVDGTPLLIGETRIGHTPVGEEVKLSVGRAFDIVGERIQTDFTKLGPRALEESYEIVVRNRKDKQVTVTVVEPMFRAAEWEIVEASHDYTKADAHTVHFEITVPAKGEESITYTVRYRW